MFTCFLFTFDVLFGLEGIHVRHGIKYPHQVDKYRKRIAYYRMTKKGIYNHKLPDKAHVEFLKTVTSSFNSVCSFIVFIAIELALIMTMKGLTGTKHLNAI